MAANYRIARLGLVAGLTAALAVTPTLAGPGSVVTPFGVSNAWCPGGFMCSWGVDPEEAIWEELGVDSYEEAAEALGVPPPSNLGGPMGLGALVRERPAIATAVHGSPGSRYYTFSSIEYTSVDHDGYKVAGGRTAGFDVDATTTTSGIAFEAGRHFGMAPRQVLIGGSFTYSAIDGNFGIGAAETDLYAVEMFLRYSRANHYATARLAYGIAETDAFDAFGAAEIDSDGVAVSFEFGRIVPLTRGEAPASIKDAPVAPARQVYLDASGRFGYYSIHGDSFVDTTGTPFGSQENSSWMIGARAAFLAPHQREGMVLTPFVAFSIDQQLGYDHTFDGVDLDQSDTFFGIEGGMTVDTASGLRVAIATGYTGSGDQDVFTAGIGVRIPFSRGHAEVPLK